MGNLSKHICPLCESAGALKCNIVLWWECCFGIWIQWRIFSIRSENVMHLAAWEDTYLTDTHTGCIGIHGLLPAWLRLLSYLKIEHARLLSTIFTFTYTARGFSTRTKSIWQVLHVSTCLHFRSAANVAKLLDNSPYCYKWDLWIYHAPAQAENLSAHYANPGAEV